MSAGPFLTVDEAAEVLRTSRRVVHGMTAARTIPHRRLPKQRRCLFLMAELERYVDNPALELEVVELDGGGRIVRPVRP